MSPSFTARYPCYGCYGYRVCMLTGKLKAKGEGTIWVEVDKLRTNRKNMKLYHEMMEFTEGMTEEEIGKEDMSRFKGIINKPIQMCRDPDKPDILVLEPDILHNIR